MAFELKTWWCLIILSLILNLHDSAHGILPRVPCYYIFGDSLSDVGNNNNLATLAKSNYLPYGIDFPLGPTGRFSNGRNMVDIIAERLGFNHSIPPFATAKGVEILQGVNYASGSAGIRNETSEPMMGEIYTMDKQLLNHLITVSHIAQILGNHDLAATYLNKCLYSVYVGTNDYINNYFSPWHNTSRQYTPEQYAFVLVQQYSQQLRTLYNYGARKIAIFGLLPIGRTPLAMHGTNGFPGIESVNNAIQLFNEKLKLLVDDFNKTLIDAKFIYINVYEIMSMIFSSPGFKVKNAPCCKVMSFAGICIPLQNPCPNRHAYVFWDTIHPTEAVHSIIGKRAYRALLPTDAYPFDISHLVRHL